MKLFEKQKIEEVLTLNWTKYIDYKMLLNFIVNAVPLYASNWAMIKQYKKIQGNKITISKVSLLQNDISFWVSFEIPSNSGVALGTAEILSSIHGDFKMNNISGTILVD